MYSCHESIWICWLLYPHMKGNFDNNFKLIHNRIQYNYIAFTGPMVIEWCEYWLIFNNYCKYVMRHLYPINRRPWDEIHTYQHCWFSVCGIFILPFFYFGLFCLIFIINMYNEQTSIKVISLLDFGKRFELQTFILQGHGQSQ